MSDVNTIPSFGDLQKKTALPPDVTNRPAYKSAAALAPAMNKPPAYLYDNIGKTGQALYGESISPPSLWDKIQGSWDQFKVGAERAAIGTKRFFGTATKEDLQKDEELKKQQQAPKEQLGNVPNAIFQAAVGLGYTAATGANVLADWAAATLTGGAFNTKLGRHFEAAAQQQQNKFLGNFIGGAYTQMRDSGVSTPVARGVGIGILALQSVFMGLPISKIPGVSKLFDDALNEATSRVMLNGSVDKVLGVTAGKYAGRMAEIGAYNTAAATVNVLAPEFAKVLNNKIKGTNLPTSTAGDILKGIFGQAGATTLVMGALGLPGAIREDGLLADTMRGMADKQESAPEVAQTPEPALVPAPMEAATRAKIADETVGTAAKTDISLPGEQPKELTPVQAEKLDQATKSEEGASDYIDNHPSIKAIVTQIEDKQSQIKALGDREQGLKAVYEQQLSALNEAKTNAAASMRAQIKARGERNAMIRNIATVKKRLPTMRTGSPNLEAHEAFLKPLRELLDQFNTVKPTEATLKGLAEIKRNLSPTDSEIESGVVSERPVVTVPQRMISRLEELNQTPLRDLTNEDLKIVHDAVMAYAKEAKDRTQVIINGKAVDRDIAMQGVLASLRKGRLTTEQKGQVETEAHRNARSALGALRSLAWISELQYDTMINWLGGGEDAPIYDILARAFDNGTKTARDLRVQWRGAWDKWFEDNKTNQEKFLNELVTIPDARTGNEGPLPLTVTRGHLLSAWMHRQWPQNWEHFQSGVAMPGWLRGGESVIQINPAAIEKAFQTELGDAGKQFAEHLASIVKQSMTPGLSNKFYENNGYPMEEPDFYWPINVARNALSANAASQDIVRQQMSRSGAFISVDKSHVMPRVNSKLPIYWQPVQDDFDAMVRFSSDYIGLSDVTANAARVVRDPGFKNALLEAYGTNDYHEAIVNGINAMTGHRYVPNAWESAILQARNTGIASALSINPTPVVRNLLLTTRSLQYVPAEDWLAGTTLAILHPRKTHELLNAKSSYYSEVSKRGSSVGTRSVMEQARKIRPRKGVSGAIANAARHAERIGLAPEMWSIAQTYRMEMSAAVHYALRAFKGGIDDINLRRATGKTPEEWKSMNGNERTDAAVSFAEYVMKRTHASGEPQYQANLVLQGNTLGKLIAVLGSEGNAATNMLIRAGIDAGKTKGGWKRFGKALFALGVLAPASTYGVYKARDVLEKKPQKQQYTLGEAATTTGAEMVYGVGNIAYALEQTLKGTPQAVQGMISGRLSDLITGIANLHRASSDKTYKGRQNALVRGFEDISGSLASFAGLPFWTARSMIQGIGRWMNGG